MKTMRNIDDVLSFNVFIVNFVEQIPHLFLVPFCP